tara:strand:+ start:291 stop:1604 length:1314 start_codon:yes stop_codon:yes gene_type:complete
MGITRLEYQARRTHLARQMAAGSVAIIPAAKEILRNGDSHYRFRQDSNFLYLTGFAEPEALLVIFAGEQGDSVLFNRSRDPAKEQWDGHRLGQEAAPEALGVRKAYPFSEAKEQLTSILSNRDTIYYPTGLFPEWEHLLSDVIKDLKRGVRRGIAAPTTLIDVVPLISEMRLFKSEAEIALMRKAASISADAHRRAMQQCRHLENEMRLEAELCYEFFRQGCRAVAYQPIVGSGENACILHYGANDQPLNNGDLVLIDAGGEYQHYAADITRTFPVSGQFSAAQRQIYELVLKAQQAGIACIKPGVKWNQVQETIIRILTLGLCELGILEGNIDTLLEKQAYLPYYMHNSGHWLGMDVHDCGVYKVNGEWRPFEPGMVLTVEPGLYFSPSLDGLEPKWRGIGVRIEDDILVTDEGYENLSAAVPVEINEIEALMRGE